MPRRQTGNSHFILQHKIDLLDRQDVKRISRFLFLNRLFHVGRYSASASEPQDSLCLCKTHASKHLVNNDELAGKV